VVTARKATFTTSLALAARFLASDPIDRVCRVELEKRGHELVEVAKSESGALIDNPSDLAEFVAEM
jgi:hypothetical protein